MQPFLFGTILCLGTMLATQADLATAATAPSPGPQKDWTDTQKFEWYIGYMSRAAALCGSYSESNELAEVAKLSPYGRAGLKSINFDTFYGAACGGIRNRAEELLQKKESYVRFLTELYGCSPDGKCLDGGTEPLASNHSCSPQVDKALERLNVSRSDIASITVRSESGHLYGNTPAHQAQVKLKNCEGTLFFDMSEQCRVKQSYTRGDCEIAGVSSF